MLIELTRESIQQDISEYQERLEAAQRKLSELPIGFLSFMQNKKRELQRRELQSEIEHVQQLIGYAQEAMDELQGGNNDEHETE